MKQRLKNLMAQMQKYNCNAMIAECFGFDTSLTYDALVVAPSWTPEAVLADADCTVTCLAKHSYFSGWLVEKGGLKIAWMQTGAVGSNVMDNMILCTEISFKKMLFLGAVGSLSADIDIGEICTPSYSIAGGTCLSYLDESISADSLFEKITPNQNYLSAVLSCSEKCGFPLTVAPVFCTDSISCEYSHLDEIRATGAKLIEMETAAFYQTADLFEIPAAALLVVSDNSASGVPLLGRSDAQKERYHLARSRAIPEILFAIAAGEEMKYAKKADSVSCQAEKRAEKKSIGMVVAIETEAVFKLYPDCRENPAPKGLRDFTVETEHFVLHIVQTGMGVIAASAGVQYLATKYNISMLFNFGVVGGLTEDTKKMKICLVKQVVHYKYDCSEFMDLQVGQVDGHDSIYLPTDENLFACAIAENDDMLPVTCCSGDKFVGTAEEKSYLHNTFGGDICDMESAGIVLACEMNGIPCLLLKAVSDGLADGAEGFYAELQKASVHCLAAAVKVMERIIASDR